jgi:gliding motility-associated-like protein
LPNAGTISGPSGVCIGSSVTLTDGATGGVWTSANSTATVSGGTVTGVSAGTDIITYSVANSCGTALAIQTITVSALPDAGTISGPDTLCVSASATLTDPAPGGAWSTANSTATVSYAGIIAGVSAGADVITYSVSNACGTATAMHTITIGPLPDAGSIGGPSSVCAGSEITLTDTAPGGIWTSSSSSASVIAGTVSGLTAGTATISYTVTNYCGSVSAIKTIIIDPLVHAGEITGPSYVCVGSAITLTDTAGGVWSSPFSGGIASIDSFSGVVSGRSVGTAIISYSVANICGTVVKTDTITVVDRVNAGSITSTHANAFCVGDTFAVASIVAGGTWSIRDTAIATLAGTHVQLLARGADTIFYTVSNACDTVAAFFPFYGGKLPAIHGSLTVCVGDTAMLDDSTSFGGMWSGGYPVAYVGTAISDSGILAGIVPGTAMITYKVDLGCAAYATVTVNASPDAGTITGTSQICKGTMTTLSDEIRGGSWKSNNPSIASVGTGSGIVTALSTGTASVVYTTLPNANNCTASASFPLTVVAPFTISSSVTPISCYGNNNGSIAIAISGGTGKYKYAWSDGHVQPSISNLVPGFYSITVKDTGSQCVVTDTFVVSQPDSISLSAIVHNDTCRGADGSIVTSVAGGVAPYQYLWSNNATGKDVTGLYAGAIVLTITDANSCVRNQSFVVEESCTSIVIPDVITPNGDGVNDQLVITGLEDFPGNTLEIFDKWGNLVYQKRSYHNDWGGQATNGGLLPDGTYFYLVKLNAENAPGGKNVFAGAILIKR